MPASIVLLGAALFVMTVISCYAALIWYFRWRRGRFTRGIERHRINLAKKRARLRHRTNHGVFNFFREN